MRVDHLGARRLVAMLGRLIPARVPPSCRPPRRFWLPSGRGGELPSGRGDRLAALAAGSTAALMASAAMTALVMACGPSVAVPYLGRSGAFPSLPIRLSPSLATALVWAAVACGGAGIAGGLAAVRRGWRPDPRLLLAAGLITAAVFAILPPAGSVDVLSYASYGRIASLGHNPYLMTPEQLYRAGDPVGLLVPPTWRGAPSVYGPVATVVQWAAARLGGSSMGAIVLLLKLTSALAFGVTAITLLRVAGPDPVRRARACLLWAVNPLMLFWLVASAHVDALAAVALAGSLLSLRRSGFLAGLLAGAAAAVRPPAGAAAIGAAWARRRSPRFVAAGLLGALVVGVPGYLLAGHAALAVLGNRFASGTGSTFPVHRLSRDPVTDAVLIGVSAVVLAALLWWRLPAGYPDVPGARAALIPLLAWLVISPVQAAWYDAMVFVFLAVIPATRLDLLVIVRCVLLSVRSLPGVGAAAPLAGASGLIYSTVHTALLLFVPVLAVMCLLGAFGPGRPPARLDHAVHRQRDAQQVTLRLPVRGEEHGDDDRGHGGQRGGGHADYPADRADLLAAERLLRRGLRRARPALVPWHWCSPPAPAAGMAGSTRVTCPQSQPCPAAVTERATRGNSEYFSSPGASGQASGEYQGLTPA